MNIQWSWKAGHICWIKSHKNFAISISVGLSLTERNDNSPSYCLLVIFLSVSSILDLTSTFKLALYQVLEAASLKY